MTAEPAVHYADYRPRGAARELFRCRAAEVVLSGPAGSGKSRSCLEKVHAIATKYPESRGLIVRKTRVSLTNTTLVTYEQLVLPLGHARVTHHGAVYPNGAEIDFGGLDKATRIMSSEYDWAYVPEATELTENDWESVTTRLRWGKVPYQQLIADCNPAQPTHWLKRRGNSGKTLFMESRHEDNPTLWSTYPDWWGSLSAKDQHKQENLAVPEWPGQGWTPKGSAYIAKLDALTGARYLRLRKGIWASAEGMVYHEWDPAIHLIDWFEPPADWPRLWSIDFGYTNPFVFQAWARDPDGRLYRYREIYRTQRLVEDHAKDILRICHGEPVPVAIICDHDAEDRATLERHLGLWTTAAFKAISPGIQAVQKRLRLAGDGKPRLFLMRDSMESADPLLVDARKPTCMEEEIESYIWDQGTAVRGSKDVPVKLDDHAVDCARYAITAADGTQSDPKMDTSLMGIGGMVEISPV